MIRFLKSPAWPVLLACALLQLPATLRAQAPDKSASLFGDPVVATGKGFEIKRSQLDDAFINYTAGAEASGNAVPEAERPIVRSKLLDNLIVSKILLLKATPAVFGAAGDGLKLLRDMIEGIGEGGGRARDESAFEDLLKRLACHGSVRVGRQLGAPEITALLTALDATPFKSNCPHGRPVHIRFARGSIERLFRR